LQSLQEGFCNTRKERDLWRRFDAVKNAALTPDATALAEAHTYPTLVVCALIIRDGCVLLERRAPAGIKGLDMMWDLPGGKVENGESPRNALIREIREELGVIVNPIELLPTLETSVWTYPDGRTLHWVLAIYRCTLDGEPTLTERLQWKRIDGLTEAEVLAPDLRAIKEGVALAAKLALPSARPPQGAAG
jgi:8-oxo-dGTP diphosphatase